MSLLTANGFFLHASATLLGDGAILFLGHSTAGKSTMARRLGTVVPVLADDAVFVYRVAPRQWRAIEGGFRFQDGDIHRWQQEILRQIQEGTGAPLRGLFRLYKASALNIQPRPAIEMARFLTDAAFEIDLQRKADICLKTNRETLIELRRKWFAWAAEIARLLPGWALYFPRDLDPSHLVPAIMKAITGSSFQ